jgi:hypothetical protein
MAENDDGCGTVAAALITAGVSLIVSFVAWGQGCSVASKTNQAMKDIETEKIRVTEQIETTRNQLTKQLADQQTATQELLAKQEADLRRELQEKDARLGRDLEVLKAQHDHLKGKIEPYCERLLFAIKQVQLQFEQLVNFAETRPMGDNSAKEPVYHAFSQLAEIQSEAAAIYVAKSVEDSVRTYHTFTLQSMIALSKDTTPDERKAIITQAIGHHDAVKASIAAFIKESREGYGGPPSTRSP